MKLDSMSEDTGIEAYTRVHRWCTEISGMGIAERASKLMNPDTPKREEEMTEAMERWEQCRRMEDLGQGLPVLHRVIALRKLVIGTGKQHLEVWEGDASSMQEKENMTNFSER